MTGLATELLYAGRSREGSRLASEQMALLESIGDPNLTMGLAFIAFANWFDSGEFGEILRWSQTVIDLADGDPTKGAGFGIGSPLAIALAFRGVARWWLGRPGWRQDLHDAVAMARNSDPATLGVVVTWTYGLGICYGVLRADDSAVRAIEEAVQTAEGQQRYRADLRRVRVGWRAAESGRRGRPSPRAGADVAGPRVACASVCPFLVPVTELSPPGRQARRGDRDAAIAAMRKAVDELHQATSGSGMAFGAPAFWWRRCWSVAPRATWPKPKRRSTGWRTWQPIKVRRCSRSRCCGCARCWPGPAATTSAYRDLVSRYRAMAESLGFEGHIAWAEAMR